MVVLEYESITRIVCCFPLTIFSRTWPVYTRLVCRSYLLGLVEMVQGGDVVKQQYGHFLPGQYWPLVSLLWSSRRLPVLLIQIVFVNGPICKKTSMSTQSERQPHHVVSVWSIKIQCLEIQALSLVVTDCWLGDKVFSANQKNCPREGPSRHCSSTRLLLD